MSTKTKSMITKAKAQQPITVPPPATTNSNTRLAWGGVSPKPSASATRGLETLVEPAAEALNTAAAHAGFVYHGGPVVKCPLIYVSFWGSQWQTDPEHKMRADHLAQFHVDLLQSNYMNVLSQYGAGSGKGSGIVVRTVFLNGVQNQLTDASIRTTLQAAIDAGTLPEPGNPSNTCIIIYLADGMGVNSPNQGLVLCEPTSDTAFGYHNFFITTQSNHCYYAVIPALNNICLQETCSSDVGCSLHLSQTQEQRQTQVASHEFCEMITDPELNAWFENGSGAENSDIVNGQAASIIVNNRAWNVQRQYSKTDDIASNGTNFSVIEAPNPLPKLVPGPAAETIPANGRTILSYDRLAPLPPIYFDAVKHTATMHDSDMNDYVKRLFYPLRPQDIMGDFSAFLNHTATILAK